VDGLDALGLNRPNGSVNYTYDTLNRINSAVTLGTACTAMAGGTLNWGSSYTVDAWGNLTAQTPTLCSAVSMSAAANSENRLTTATYDSAGNMTQNNGQGYTYDAEGRITNGSGTVYTYDGMGERVAKAGSKLYWKGVGSTALVETNTSDRNPTEYIFFNGARIARIDPGATTPKYSLTDNLGSTAVETDSLGNILNESLFFPYGVERVIEQNDTANNYKFTGKERDAETGLDDFGARYYASSLGRFMTPDWDAKPTSVPYASFGDPQTLNLYSYVENGPLNKVDADGHAASQNTENQWVDGGEYCAIREDVGSSCDAITVAEQNLGSTLDVSITDSEDESDTTAAIDSAEDATAEAQTSDQQAQQPHPYVAPTGPGTEIGNILDPAHPSNPGPITSPSDPNGQCVTSCRHFSGLPDHTQWTQGDPVVISVNGVLTVNPAIKPGTAIATFVNGQYPGDEESHKNSAIFLGPALIGPPGSIRVLDQWPGSPGPRPRDMYPNGGSGPTDNRSNHSVAYSVILAP
jgi:RHS repeat-associated protein